MYKSHIKASELTRLLGLRQVLQLVHEAIEVLLSLFPVCECLLLELRTVGLRGVRCVVLHVAKALP